MPRTRKRQRREGVVSLSAPHVQADSDISVGEAMASGASHLQLVCQHCLSVRMLSWADLMVPARTKVRSMLASLRCDRCGTAPSEAILHRPAFDTMEGRRMPRPVVLATH
jgi:hypothetical protein